MNKLPGAQLLLDPQPFLLEYGGRLPRLEIAYETWGELSPARDNVILVCPAFSAHSHARSHAADPSPGWWEQMVGPGLAIDTNRYFVVCASLLGGCYGTTGPLSENPGTGRPYGGGFPVISIRDIVRVHLRLLDHLGIDRIHTAVGGSLGGMQTLQLAVEAPHRVERVVSISATEHTRPYTATIRHVGRQAILSDPDFLGGHYEGKGPTRGLKLARQIGTIFYRSRRDFNSRFSCRLLEPELPPRVEGICFDFQSYLDYQGEKIIGRFDANSYLRLSLAMDLFDLRRGKGSLRKALQECRASFLIVGVQEDLLIPIDEQLELHRALLACGKRSVFHELSSPAGHDAFLKEFEWFTPRIVDFLQEPVRV